MLKAMEIEFDVPSQNVTTSVASKARSQNQTMRNILNKFKVKAGGRNYSCIFIVSSESLLFYEYNNNDF
jgi:hypothetical protein